LSFNLARISVKPRIEDEKIFSFIKTWYFGPLFLKTRQRFRPKDRH
jgi:hypothetical protein